jgi:Tol biopolymer transport system component
VEVPADTKRPSRCARGAERSLGRTRSHGTAGRRRRSPDVATPRRADARSEERPSAARHQAGLRGQVEAKAVEAEVPAPPMRTTTEKLRVLAALAVTASLLPGLVPGAEAAFPGLNGKIVFVSTRDGNGDNYISGEGEIYVMNTDGSGQTRLTVNAADDMDPTWSPNGQKIAFSSDRDGNHEIYVMNADGTAQTRITVNPGPDFAPTWSPDGTKIAFVRIVGGAGDIFVMNADGTAQTNITNHAADDQAPSWSALNKIVFQSNRDGDDEIGTMNPDGTGLAKLTNNTVPDYLGDWSPTGLKIYFTRNPPGATPTEVGVMNPDGTLQTRLTTNAQPEAEPAVSPDGLYVAVTTVGVGGSEDIFKAALDGLTPKVNLTSSAGLDFSADWQPIP